MAQVINWFEPSEPLKRFQVCQDQRELSLL